MNRIGKFNAKGDWYLYSSMISSLHPLLTIWYPIKSTAFIFKYIQERWRTRRCLIRWTPCVDRSSFIKLCCGVLSLSLLCVNTSGCEPHTTTDLSHGAQPAVPISKKGYWRVESACIKVLVVCFFCVVKRKGVRPRKRWLLCMYVCMDVDIFLIRAGWCYTYPLYSTGKKSV